MDYPRTGDAHGRRPVFPNLLSVTQAMEGRGVWPVVASNDIGVFTVFDTQTGYSINSIILTCDAFPGDLCKSLPRLSLIASVAPDALAVGGGGLTGEALEGEGEEAILRIADELGDL